MTTLSALMDGIDASLFAATVAPNHYAWPAESITVPCTLVGYPRVDYDLSMGRGADTWVCPVWYVVGKANNDDARDKLSTGMAAVKAALDGAHSWGDCRVTGAEPTEINVSGVAYLAAKSEAEVYG